MRRANQVVVDILSDLKNYARPGMTTMDLEKRARKLLKDSKARPVFLGYRGYPAVLCASINEEVIHGIPSERRELKDGDILSLDFGVELDGFVGDAAFTVGLGKVDAEKERLMQVTRECLEKAVAVTRPGKRLSDKLINQRVLGGLSVCRSRHRPANARGPAGPQLRDSGPGSPTQGGYGAGDRTDGE